MTTTWCWRRPGTSDAWVEIGREARVEDIGPYGVDVLVTPAFVDSLAADVRAGLGFKALVDAAPPESGEVTGLAVIDLGGEPTRSWVVVEG